MYLSSVYEENAFSIFLKNSNASLGFFLIISLKTKRYDISEALNSLPLLHISDEYFKKYLTDDLYVLSFLSNEYTIPFEKKRVAC
jgi:hypothetical protein